MLAERIWPQRRAKRIAATLALALLFPLVGCVGSIATAVVPGPNSMVRFVAPVRLADGRMARNPTGQALSTNWSGYVVTRWETGQTYTGASGTWVVPRVSAPARFRAGASAAWVGIGGYCLDRTCRETDRTLIQLGTEHDASLAGQVKYEAWYELLPAPPASIPVAVHPGDVITAGLRLTAPDSWTLSLTNRTTGQSWTMMVSYRSSLASAEWIQEAPVAQNVLPLAAYGTVTFDGLTVNGGVSPNLTPANAVRMIDPRGQSSNASPPDAERDGFATCSGNGRRLTPCPTPRP